VASSRKVGDSIFLLGNVPLAFNMATSFVQVAEVHLAIARYLMAVVRHGCAPLVLQAGARLVPQPPTPTRAKPWPAMRVNYAKQFWFKTLNLQGWADGAT
jgi:hypothetical protein